MRRFFPIASTLFLALASASDAQLASAPSDTIVRLAVDPAHYRGRPFVVLLDEGHYTVEPDGRWVQRIRQVLQVLEPTVARGLSERQFGYSKSHQLHSIQWVRVLKANGEVVSDKPAQEQDSDVPAAMSNPIYQDQRVKRISLSGVAAGTIIDMAYTTEEKTPGRAGDFLFRWSLNNPAPIINTRFVLDMPASYTPRVHESNVAVRRTEQVVGGRKQILWVASNVPPVVQERFSADSNDVVQSISVAGTATWTDISRWYEALSKDRYTILPAIAQRVDSIVRASNATTRIDTVRALHRWVAQDIRYLSVSLGLGGYQPRMPAEVLSSGFGDCKDKATLFVAALRRYRIPAYQVLLSNTGRSNRALPSIHQFNHAIAAVGDGASRVFTDLTAEHTPYGYIPDSYQGGFGLLVKADGSGEELIFPRSPSSASTSTMIVALALDSTGRLSGRVTHSVTGQQANTMRQVFSQGLDSARKAQAADVMARQIFPANVKGDSFVAFDPKKLEDPVSVSYNLVAEQQLKPAGDTRVLSLSNFFRGPAIGFRNLGRDLKSRPARRFTIDAGQILAPIVTTTDVRITLPPGWTAELPKNVLASSFFGTYQSTWSQEGQEIRMVRRIQGERGYFPPERIAEVITWLESVAADDYEFLVFRPLKDY